jgi:hypothetical protein
MSDGKREVEKEKERNPSQVRSSNSMAPHKPTFIINLHVAEVLETTMSTAQEAVTSNLLNPHRAQPLGISLEFLTQYEQPRSAGHSRPPRSGRRNARAR